MTEEFVQYITPSAVIDIPEPLEAIEAADISWMHNLDLLTIDEAAEVLRCGSSTVYRAIKDGKLASVRFGRCVRVRRVDLAAFVSRAVLVNSSVAETEGECKPDD